jgi:hypothetical protein
MRILKNLHGPHQETAIERENGFEATKSSSRKPVENPCGEFSRHEPLGQQFF